jgi:hypothetical protein
MTTMEQTIAAIGTEVVACSRNCDGVFSNPPQGIIPRGLLLESRSPDDAGVVLLGMNPGQGDDRERSAFQADRTFEATVHFMTEHRLLKHEYYKRLRLLANECGLRGHLLWTELAKCQSAEEVHGSLPLETYRTCASVFLRREVEATPASWAIFAVGRDAYRAAAFMFSERSVVGLAHPTGSYGNWHAMFANGRLKPEVRNAVQRILSERRAAWIADELLRASSS